MILVDTSVWIHHLRTGEPALAEALEDGQVLLHPFVLGEIACGQLNNRAEILGLLDDLPKAPTVSDVEARDFIESHRLMGIGIGYIDVHLLASAVIAGNARLWSRDRRLTEAAAGIGLETGKPG